MPQNIKLASIITFIFACTSSCLFAQTKIELTRHFVYKVPLNEPENERGKRKLTNNPWERRPQGIWLSDYVISKTITDQERENLNDGTAKIYSYTGDSIVTGMYRFDYDSEGWSGFFQLWFPVVRNIKKIEFYDKDGLKKFEDVFESVPLYSPEIVRISNNSFSVQARSGVYLSQDRAKTWDSIKVDYDTNTFSIAEDIINNSNTVIVVIAYDPNPPYEPGVALWAPNPADYVFGFADDEEPAQTVQSAPAPTINSSSNNANTNKGFLSRIFGK